MTIELWNFLKVLHEFSGMTAVGALLAALVITIRATRATDGSPAASHGGLLRAVSRWLVGPALGLLLASGLGLALTNSYRFSPTFVALGLGALLGAIVAWAVLMIPAEARLATGAVWGGAARRWLSGWTLVMVLLLFGAAIMIIRPVWWSGVSAAAA